MPVLGVLVLAVLALDRQAAAQSNVLLIIADDVGVDMIGAYGEHPSPADTPHLDMLAGNGILFRNAWSHPSCSPTRATLLTGRYPHETGIGRAIWPAGDQVELSLGETSIAEVLGPSWNTAAVGKWHLQADAKSGLQHPMLQGFDHHWGSPWNLPDATPSSYYNYAKSIDGQLTTSTVYATTDQANDAVELIGSFTEPWFVWLAFNSAHTPWHSPPADLQGCELPHDPGDDKPLTAKAMVEAMDTELGRMFARIGPAAMEDTIVIFVGDNGTHSDATTAPFLPQHAKATIFEGGINVPLIISGPGVAQGFECDGLVELTDIFATIADIGRATPPPASHGVSLTPYFTEPRQPSLRSWVFAERFIPNGFGPYLSHQRAVRDVRFKLVQALASGLAIADEMLFDLEADPWEETNLLDAPLSVEARLSYEVLRGVLAGMAPPWTPLGNALAGSQGSPSLKGGGTLLPGDDFTLKLSKAAHDSTAWLVVGFEAIDAPFKGGIMVPDPSAPGLLIPVATGANGTATLQGAWPFGVPSGWETYLQWWIQDGTNPAGWAASNGVKLTAP